MTDDAVIDDVAVAVREVVLAAERIRVVAFRSRGVSVIESQALGHLYAEGPMAQRDLQAHLYLSSGSTTALVDRLADAGMVERRVDTADRRRTELHITDQGSAVMAELLGWVREACAELPPELAGDAAETFRTVARGMNERTTADVDERPEYEHRNRR